MLLLCFVIPIVNSNNSNIHCPETATSLKVEKGGRLLDYIERTVEDAKVASLNRHIVSEEGNILSDGFVCIAKDLASNHDLDMKDYLGFGQFKNTWGPSFEFNSGILKEISRNEMLDINNKVKVGTSHLDTSELISSDTYLIDLDIKQESLRYALEEISKQIGISIMLSDEYDVLVSATVEDKPLTSVLNMLTKPFGLIWSMNGEYIIISSKDDDVYEELFSQRVYKPKNTKVKDILKLLPENISAYIKANEKNELIMISAPSSEVSRILKLITKLDLKNKNIALEAFIVDIEQRAEKKLGIDWWNDAGFSGSVAGEKFSIFGKDDKFSALLNNTPGLTNVISVSNVLNEQLPSGVDVFFPAADILSPLNVISSSINALSEKGMANVLATPKIISSSGEKATFKIDTTHVVPILSGPTSFMQTIIRTFKSGVSLEITATITSDNYIHLNLHRISVSTLLRTGKKQIDGSRLPVVTSRTISTNITLKNQQVLAIGGLSDSTSLEYQRELPIDNMKYNTGINMQKTRTRNLLILIYPSVIRQDSTFNMKWNYLYE